MTNIHNPQVLRKVGIPTPQTVIYKSESHKLHQAFPAKKVDGVPIVILPGMPVKLNTDGTIQPYVGTGIYIGMAVTDSQNPAYPEGALGPEVTVMVEAFAVVYAKASADSGDTLDCGEVVPTAIADDDFYVPYEAPESGSESDHPQFINITPGAADGELIQVLIR